MATFIDLTGKRFGRLLVVSRVDNESKNRTKSKWFCNCDCGNTNKIVDGGNLRFGSVKSCGCLMRESRIKANLIHGHTRHTKKNSKEYYCWVGIKTRCLNKNSPNYLRYGGRGIKMCDRWLESFQNFYEDIGPCPSSEHSIERKNRNGNYDKENCVWATAKIQNHNRENSIEKITIGNKTMELTEWCEFLGMSYDLVWTRIRIAGWAPERALTTPKKKTEKSIPFHLMK